MPAPSRPRTLPLLLVTRTTDCVFCCRGLSSRGKFVHGRFRWSTTKKVHCFFMVALIVASNAAKDAGTASAPGVSVSYLLPSTLLRVKLPGKNTELAFPSASVCSSWTFPQECVQWNVAPASPTRDSAPSAPPPPLFTALLTWWSCLAGLRSLPTRVMRTGTRQNSWRSLRTFSRFGHRLLWIFEKIILPPHLSASAETTARPFCGWQSSGMTSTSTAYSVGTCTISTPI
mmetsp:Transcript_68654/g.193684  ORF Transcript_68654/g.193684 Transcript_68654/m.193684 type:complete len:230 (-) Transcript_68654:157-846(-)